MTTDKRNFDEEPQLTHQTDSEAEESVENEDTMAEELALEEAGSAAAVPEQQPIESENVENNLDTPHLSEEPSGSHALSDQTATGSIFATFGVIPSTHPSNRTQLRSGVEEANWFNQFRERLAQSFNTPQSGEVETFGMTEAAEVPIRQQITESDDTNEAADTTANTDAANGIDADTVDTIDSEITATAEEMVDDGADQPE